MFEELKLNGKVAVIASGGQSLAAELARYLHGAGARIVVITSDAAKINEISASLPPDGVLGLPAALTSEKEITGSVERAVARFGKIDILVNHLNTEIWKPFLDTSANEWQGLMQANVTPAFLLCKTVGKYLVAQKSGAIVNVISALAERAVTNGVAYCAGMGAILELTRSLALEWAPFNVRVNAVGVGWRERPAGAPGKDIMARYIPAQHRTRPQDVAPLVGFLASGASSFISGYMYTVDGGLMARA